MKYLLMLLLTTVACVPKDQDLSTLNDDGYEADLRAITHRTEKTTFEIMGRTREQMKERCDKIKNAALELLRKEDFISFDCGKIIDIGRRISSTRLLRTEATLSWSVKRGGLQKLDVTELSNDDHATGPKGASEKHAEITDKCLAEMKKQKRVWGERFLFAACYHPTNMREHKIGYPSYEEDDRFEFATIMRVFLKPLKKNLIYLDYAYAAKTSEERQRVREDLLKYLYREVLDYNKIAEMNSSCSRSSKFFSWESGKIGIAYQTSETTELEKGQFVWGSLTKSETEAFNSWSRACLRAIARAKKRLGSKYVVAGCGVPDNDSDVRRSGKLQLKSELQIYYDPN